MSFNFEDLGNVINETGREMADKAKEYAARVRLKTKIKSEESKIRMAYMEIGRRVYEEKKECFCEDENFSELFGQVEEIRRQIDDYEAELNLFFKGIVCPECGRRNEEDAQFCSGCGTKLEKPVEEEPVDEFNDEFSEEPEEPADPEE